MATEQEQAKQLMKAQLDIAELQTHLEYQRASMAQLKAGQDSLLAQLRQIQDLLGEARGGWRMLMLMGGAGALLGSVLSYVLEHFHWRG